MIDSDNEVNIITPAYTAKLGLTPRPTNIGAQKIDGSVLGINGITIAGFLMERKFERIRFFEKTFVLANISKKVILGMSYFLLSHVNVDFKIVIKRFIWKFYDSAEMLPTTSRV